jgi:hypothetical protein
MVELDDSSQQNCRGDRRKAGNNKGADKIVVANHIGNQPGAPREKRIKPCFHHAGRVVAKLGDLQIVKRIQRFQMSSQPTLPGSGLFSRIRKLFAPKINSKILIASTHPTTSQSSLCKKRTIAYWVALPVAPDQAHVRFHRSSSLLSLCDVRRGNFVLEEQPVKLLAYIPFDLALREL